MRIISPNTKSPEPELVAEAATILDQGGVIALPTETVYGICCRSGLPDAVERIYALKGRDHGKALPYLIADEDDVLGFVNEVPRIARTLMKKFWPGPLTLVLGEEPGVALRLPDHEFTRAVIRAAQGPVMGTSANVSGEHPATTARRVERYFPEGLDLLCDGGKSRIGKASTLVKIYPDGRTTVLREGQVATESIQASSALTVAIVCTGNTCRSPMAAVVLKSLLAERLGVPVEHLVRAGFRILSAGVSAFPGRPMSQGAQEALAQSGLDPDDHQSRPWTSELNEEADVIWTLTSSHLEALADRYPELAKRVSTLDPSGGDIGDPFGQPVEVYRACLQEIRAHLEARVNELLPK